MSQDKDATAADIVVSPRPGVVYFIGAGPGAPDLITVRGRDIIAQADLMLYADSLVSDAVARLTRKPGVRIIGSSGLHLDAIIDMMVETARAGGVVARVHTGDATLYGAIHEQMMRLDAAGVVYEIVPGVTATFAAAARLGVELTVPELAQSVIFTRAAGRTPMPAGENLRALAAHGATLSIYLSVQRIRQAVDDLLAGGSYAPETPAVVLHKVTWPDESVVRGTLVDIADQAEAAGYTRHALILVGPALDPRLTPAGRNAHSRLYAATFSHGFRRAEIETSGCSEAPTSEPAGGSVIAVTRQGVRLAARLARELDAELVAPIRWMEGVADADLQADGASVPATAVYDGSVVREVRRRWQQHQQLVLVMAAGVAVRAIAPLLGRKTDDPAVVCLDEAGRAVIPLLGGHQAGANDLARRIAALTSGYAAITTASDVQTKPALDLLGRAEGWRIDPASRHVATGMPALTYASARLVNDEPVGVYVDPALSADIAEPIWRDHAENLLSIVSPDQLAGDAYAAGLIVSHRRMSDQRLGAKCVFYRPPVLVVGIGCRRGAPMAELRAALDQTLADADLAPESVGALATVDVKADEPGLRELAAALGVPLRIIPRDRLAALDPATFTPSAARSHLDVPGVAEPCAIVVSGGELLVPKRAFARCTVAVALASSGIADDAPMRQIERQPTAAFTRAQSPTTSKLVLISLGPGDPAQMTVAAREALRVADVVIGYRAYVDLVRPLLSPDQNVVAMPMKSEIERARQAIDMAAAGRRVALISSGDIGIYAMAGPVFEALRERGWDGADLEVEVLPGVSAVQAASARLGASISHDFCAISLSDLLTPWEVIERRLWAAAQGDFVVGLYNPRSRDRDWQLERAINILLHYRPATTPVALVRNVTRADESITLTTLAELEPNQADMFSLVLIGNSQSYRLGDYLVTPRGYRDAAMQRDRATSIDPVARTPADDVAVYPLMLTQMRGAPVAVVGGGPVGERKVRGLLAVSASVRLISPRATPQLRAWAEAGRLQWHQRNYQTGDLEQPRPTLVFAATDRREVNAQIAHDARTLGVLCNVADAPDEGAFHLPAVHRGRGLTIAVSTAGEDPARARDIRDWIGKLLNDADFDS